MTDESMREMADKRHDVRGVNRFLFLHEHGKFWRSINGVTVCGECHPPAGEEVVEERIDG